MAPVPKRSDAKLGHPMVAADLEETTRLYIGGEPSPIPPSREHWNEVAREWYRSLSRSAIARLMEPSDWASAQFLAELITRLFEADKMNAQLAATVWRGMTDMLSTEGARRRVRIEIERGEAPEELGSVAAIAAMFDVA